MTNSVGVWRELAEREVLPDENAIAKESPGNCGDLTIIRISLLVRHEC